MFTTISRRLYFTIDDLVNKSTWPVCSGAPVPSLLSLLYFPPWAVVLSEFLAVDDAVDAINPTFKQRRIMPVAVQLPEP